jgi:hypothetical protein
MKVNAVVTILRLEQMPEAVDGALLVIPGSARDLAYVRAVTRTYVSLAMLERSLGPSRTGIVPAARDDALADMRFAELQRRFPTIESNRFCHIGRRGDMPLSFRAESRNGAAWEAAT